MRRLLVKLVGFAVLLFGIPGAAQAMGILVPAYFYPFHWNPSLNQWDDLASAASSSGVPIAAIMNPASGPGTSSNSDWVLETTNFKNAGGTLLGYVWIDYTNRPIADVKVEVDRYYNWYGVDGIFFDTTTTANDPLLVAYQTDLRDHVHTWDANAVIVNNYGTHPSSAYEPTADQHVVYENNHSSYGFVSNWLPQSWYSSYSADRFASLAYNVPTVTEMQSAVAHANTHGVDWIYVTDDSGINPWDTLPSYWSDLLSEAALYP